MTDVTRFPAQVPFDKWPDASRCYELMIAGDWDGLREYFAAHRQNVTDSIGAVNYWREKFTPGAPIVTSASPINHSPLDLQFPDNTIATAFRAEVDGNGSASVSGNAAGLWGAVFNSPPERISTADMPYYGTETFHGAPIRAGQWLVVLSGATQPLQGRVDIRIP